MLLQVPKGQGGARIRSGSVTASITGTTIMIENLPQKRVRVLVLEGSLRLTLNSRSGEVQELTAGRMVTVDPRAKQLPEPVTVDLRKVVSSSSLIDPRGFKGNSKAKPLALPSVGLILKEIALQDERRGALGSSNANGRALGKTAGEGDASLKTSPTTSRAQEAAIAKAAAGQGNASDAKARVAVAKLLREGDSGTTAKEKKNDKGNSGNGNVSGNDGNSGQDNGKSGKDNKGKG